MVILLTCLKKLPKKAHFSTHFFEYFTQLFECFRMFSNVFDRFRTFLSAFFLPILPKPYNPTSRPPFFPQNPNVSAIKSLPKIAENTLSVEKTSHKEENKIKTRLIKEFENVLEFI